MSVNILKLSCTSKQLLVQLGRWCVGWSENLLGAPVRGYIFAYCGSLKFYWLREIHWATSFIWAWAQHFLQDCLCAQRRLRSVCASAQSGQSLCRTLAKDPKRLQAERESVDHVDIKKSALRRRCHYWRRHLLYNYWLLRYWIWRDIHLRIPILTETLAEVNISIR